MGEGGTPLIVCPKGTVEGGYELYVKDESRNPTWSHKDRLNLCIISTALALGCAGSRGGFIGQSRRGLRGLCGARGTARHHPVYAASGSSSELSAGLRRKRSSPCRMPSCAGR